MPNDTKDRRDLTPEELAAKEERFRSFFSTTAVELPEEMTRHDSGQPEEKPKRKFGIFSRGKAKMPEEPAGKPLEMLTGEVLLGEDAEPEEEADLELVLKPTADPESALPLRPLAQQEPSAAKPMPEPPKEPERAVEVEPEKEALPQQKQPCQPPKNPKNAPETLLPQEEREQQEMAQLKAMINGMSSAEPEKKADAQKEPPKPETTRLGAVFAAARETPAEAAEKAEKPAAAPQKERRPDASVNAKKPVFFGVPEDEEKPEAPAAPAEKADSKEDTMSLPLLPVDEEAAGMPEAGTSAQPDKPARDIPAEETPSAASKAVPENEPAEEPTPETPADRLRRMGAELTLRCALAGILAVVLLHFGLVSDGLLPAMASLDPDAAPAAFYGANLLLFAASLAVGFPVLRDGFLGLKRNGRPTADTMPALAAAAALLQTATAMLNANVYRGTTGISLLSGVAALGLFLALLGSRVMLAAIKGGYELALREPDPKGAYRARDKDLLRALARDLEQKDPWVLLSRPLKENDGFVEQSLGERASERRIRKTSYLLLGIALLSGVLFLLAGAGWNKATAAMAAVLCMGAPLSSTLVAGVAALRLQKAAAAVGAVVPGWKAIEQLGGIDTLQVDTDDLFAPGSTTLEDIRIFKGGRIDRAILYAASILSDSCGTLRGMFGQIIEERTEILFPVKDLEKHIGLGFAGWCDNNRVLIGTRQYMEQEDVPLPDEEYEAQHSRNGELQVLYLAVSGVLHAMFVLKTVGGRNAARSLAVLQKENIRLLVIGKDPSLTARHINEAYHLPEGMITMLDQEQCDAIAAAPQEPESPEDICCMIHAGNFTSMTGGLQAADQAQNAETFATTVQLVSVGFSVAIAVLLTSAGSIWQLSVATVLMYQAAWSALSIATCALKQHN